MSKESELNENATVEENAAVRKFYNSKVETGLDQRNESRIVHLRNFNNWVKSVLIKEHVTRLNKENPNQKFKNKP